jgi:hypothetical protein
VKVKVAGSSSHNVMRGDARTFPSSNLLTKEASPGTSIGDCLKVPYNVDGAALPLRQRNSSCNDTSCHSALSV